MEEERGEGTCRGCGERKPLTPKGVVENHFGGDHLPASVKHCGGSRRPPEVEA